MTTTSTRSTETVVLATDVAELASLVDALGGEHIGVPSGASDAKEGWTWTAADSLERWRDDVGAGPRAGRVVVAAWSAAARPARLIDLDDDQLATRIEQPLAVWLAALGVAVRRCADDGAIVAVVERPPPLDSAGWAPESGIADAVEAWVRSLDRSEGPRGVRVNAVTTPGRLVAPVIVDPAPSLASFPGSVDYEVLEAVRMLTGPGVAGVTGTIVHADCGRSWR